MAQHGGVVDDPELGGYVATVGGKLAAVSELSDRPFTFTVLNSPIVNAFALPGGYIYVTRGILALFNSEAEMASVLGHEIGHVTARHSAKRYNQQMFAGILGAGVGILTKNAELSRALNYGSQAYLASYSRDQEYQSDELGVRYSTKSGFDPYAAADMLNSLDSVTKLNDIVANRTGSSRPPEFFSTHPNTQNRVARAFQAAQNTGVAQNSIYRNQNRYLDAIDGMIYGDDPKQGLIRGRTFWHPELRFTFDAPENYRMQNSSQAVIAQGTGPAAGGLAIFSGAPFKDMNLMQYTSAAWKSLLGEKPLNGLEELNINGMRAITGWNEVTVQNTAAFARIVAIQYSSTQGYHFVMVIPKANQTQLAEGLQRMTYSFRKLSSSEANKYRAKRIKIATVRSGDTASKLANKMAVDNYPLERFLVLNGLAKNDVLKIGQRVKLIVE